MRRILYAGGAFSTTDSMADALMEYASVLAIVNSADVVSLPGVDDQGTVREFTMTIGPASQILTVTTDHVSAELNTEEEVEELQRRGRHFLPDSRGVEDAAPFTWVRSDSESAVAEPGDTDGGPR
jgi:hypothetical protein